MSRVQSPDLVSYLAEFRLDLAELTPEQASMFVAGRNAAEHVEDLEAPAASRRQDRGEPLPVERPADRAVELTGWAESDQPSHLPADEMDVRLAGSVEELPRVFPVQWLLEEVQPDLFYAKLAGRELLVPEWQRPAPDAPEASQEAPDHDLADETSVADAALLHAYVLLDTSSTMQDLDRRGTVARGLALEFLRRGHVRGARLHVRPFAVEVGELQSGGDDDAFREMARRVIRLANSGQTRIQAALERAVADIRGEGPCRGARIALVTDGISRLTQNPLRDEELHTFVLGDLSDEERAGGTVAILKQWSDTFRRIWKTWFGRLLAPRWDDCQAAAALLAERLRDRSRAGSDSAKLRRLLENVRHLLKEHKRSLGKRAPAPPHAQALEALLHEAEQALARDGDAVTAQPDEQRPISGPRRRVFRLSTAAPSGEADDGPSLWAFLVHWVAQLCRRLIHR